MCLIDLLFLYLTIGCKRFCFDKKKNLWVLVSVHLFYCKMLNGQQDISIFNKSFWRV